MDYKTFKREMKNLKSYYKERKKLEEKLETLNYNMTGVKGVRFDREPSVPNYQAQEELRLEQIEDKEILEMRLTYTNLAIKLYERNLNALPSDIREICECLFIKGQTFTRIAKKHGYSINGLQYQIEKEVEKL